jgi:predicted amidohydrolase YtcJ
MRRPSLLVCLALGLLALCLSPARPTAQAGVTAIVGATLIDGTGNAPVPNAVIVIENGRVVAAGPASQVSVPAGAVRTEAAGAFVVPGFFDTNVHLSLYGGVNERYETLVRYHDRPTSCSRPRSSSSPTA